MHEWGMPDLMRERRGDARTNWAAVCDPNDGIGMKYAEVALAALATFSDLMGKVLERNL